VVGLDGLRLADDNVDPEEGVVGAALLVALIAMFVAALVVPGVFDDEGVLFGAAFLGVCATHLALYALAGRRDRELLGTVLRLAPWTLLGAILILVAGLIDAARVWLWVAALVWTYVGAAVSGSTGWHVHPSHLAERYGLVLIIALGEAFISIGIGVTGIGIGLGEVVAAILGLLVATSFWLAYFDFFSIRGERMLHDLQGAERVALARDELDSVAAFALCGGSALYLLTYSTIRTRIQRRLTVSSGRFVAALVLLLVLPLATAVPALAALALVTAVWLGLHAYELVQWREARAESRSMLASP
jgi:low temperature requirement protein LtrA